MKKGRNDDLSEEKSAVLIRIYFEALHQSDKSFVQKFDEKYENVWNIKKAFE